MRLERNVQEEQLGSPTKVNRRWLGKSVNLDWTNTLQRATGTCREQHGRWEPRRARLCQPGELKRPRTSVWEAEQAWARTNQAGPPVSVPRQGKQFSGTRREAGILGQAQEPPSWGWAREWPWELCLCTTLGAAPSQGCRQTGLWAPLGPKL